MATKQKNVQIVEINEGTKIALEQDGFKLTFGDDELSIRCDKYQKDWGVHLDICADQDGNLVIGVGTGRFYVAQVDIPPVKYEEAEPVDFDDADGYDETHETGSREALPLDMGDVVVTLWSIDDILA